MNELEYYSIRIRKIAEMQRDGHDVSLDIFELDEIANLLETENKMKESSVSIVEEEKNYRMKEGTVFSSKISSNALKIYCGNGDCVYNGVQPHVCNYDSRHDFSYPISNYRIYPHDTRGIYYGNT